MSTQRQTLYGSICELHDEAAHTYNHTDDLELTAFTEIAVDLSSGLMRLFDDEQFKTVFMEKLTAKISEADGDELNPLDRVKIFMETMEATNIGR